MALIDEDVETTTQRVYRNQDFDVPPAEPFLELEAVKEVTAASPPPVEEPEPVAFPVEEPEAVEEPNVYKLIYSS